MDNKDNSPDWEDFNGQVRRNAAEIVAWMKKCGKKAVTLSSAGASRDYTLRRLTAIANSEKRRQDFEEAVEEILSEGDKAKREWELEREARMKEEPRKYPPPKPLSRKKRAEIAKIFGYTGLAFLRETVEILGPAFYHKNPLKGEKESQ